MSKRWARIFLALMTALCLWGAWMTPFHLAIPEEGPGSMRFRYHFDNRLLFDSELREGDFAAIVSMDRVVNGVREGNFQYAISDQDPESKARFYALLPTLDLRLTSGWGGGVSGDFTSYDISIHFSPHQYLYLINVSQCNGHIKADGYANGHYFKVLNPEPLYHFLEGLSFEKS